MRAFLVLLLFSTFAAAQDAPKGVTITLEPLGDRAGAVVTKIVFRFANPRKITEAGLFLEGSFRQERQVAKNFRIAVPRKDDKGAWEDSVARNGQVIRSYRWTMLPDQRNEIAMIHTFTPGAVEVEARLVLERDYGAPSELIATSTEAFTIAKTNVALAEVPIEEEEAPVSQPSGAVTIRDAGPTAASNVYRFTVDVLPPVKRVEFWVEDKKIVARNAPPYVAELELGSVAEPVVRAIGYAAGGRYVDADAFVVSTAEKPLAVTITRTATADQVTHIKVSVRAAKGVRVKRVILYAGEKKLGEWERPPYALDVPSASLAGVESLRAVVIDEAGNEANSLVKR